jgi:hypothetical protein
MYVPSLNVIYLVRSCFALLFFNVLGNGTIAKKTVKKARQLDVVTASCLAFPTSIFSLFLRYQ